MPRKTKEIIEDEKTTKTSKTTKTAKNTKTTKKATVKKEPTKKATPKKTTTKKTTTKKESNKKAVNKTVNSRKTTKKATTTKNKKTTNSKTKKETFINNLEYYDLPYRYNQTIVKILAQTPNTLFIYWDISDTDRKNLETNYGNNFFEASNPVLIIHNETKNYTFEIEINDFANSWYLHLTDADCKYNIELGRRFKNISSNNTNINKYVYICSSNELITPNDHILFNYANQIQFKNVKTNTFFTKEIKNMKYIITKDTYKDFYSEEILTNHPTSNVMKK